MQTVEPARFAATSRQVNALPGQSGLEIGIIDDDVDKCNSPTTRRSVDHLSFMISFDGDLGIQTQEIASPHWHDL